MNWIQYKTIQPPPTGQTETICPRMESGRLFLDIAPGLSGEYRTVEVPAPWEGWHRVPYSWGLSPAAAYARAEHGVWVELVSGLEAHAPMPTWRRGQFATGAECDL
jgi:hypothetical protein